MPIQRTANRKCLCSNLSPAMYLRTLCRDGCPPINHCCLCANDRIIRRGTKSSAYALYADARPLLTSKRIGGLTAKKKRIQKYLEACNVKQGTVISDVFGCRFSQKKKKTDGQYGSQRSNELRLHHIPTEGHSSLGCLRSFVNT
jgi:hypothetical protein